MIKALTISGSLRKDSHNRKLIKAVNSLLSDSEIEFQELDLLELDLPILNADNEPSPSVKKLNDMVSDANLIIIATPEYNRSIPGGLKNAIDSLFGSTPFENKVVMVIGASTGGFGTVRSQLHLKQVLTAMGAYMVPYIEVLISHAKEAFDENDKLKDSEAQDRLEALVQKSIDLAKKI